jgi:hypothetical protein
MSDPWEDEGFGGEDDWAGTESLEADLEDGDEDGLEPDEMEDEPDLDDEQGPDLQRTQRPRSGRLQGFSRDRKSALADSGLAH